MPDTATLTAALNEVRSILQLDGADCELQGWDPDTGTANVRLVVANVSCLECVLPTPQLQKVTLESLRRQLAGVHDVVIDDPRNTL